MVITINSRNRFSFYFFNTSCYIVCHLTDTSRKIIKLFITFYNFLIKSMLIKFNLIKIINYIINIGEKQLVGADAETDYAIVDLDQPVEGGSNKTTYHARKIRVAVEVASFTNDDGEMGCSGNFLAKGDPVEGTFDTATKTFTATTEVA